MERVASLVQLASTTNATLVNFVSNTKPTVKTQKRSSRHRLPPDGVEKLLMTWPIDAIKNAPEERMKNAQMERSASLIVSAVRPERRLTLKPN
jgi:hypothetical protein